MRLWKFWKRADPYNDRAPETWNSAAAYLFFQTNRTDENCSLQEAPEITIEDREALRRAVKSLEHPSLAGRLTNLVGKPVELIGYALPSFASKAIASATSREAALKVALRTLPFSPRTNSQFLHRALATASGAAGGTFGPAALPGRTAGVDHHHAAVDRGASRRRQPTNARSLPPSIVRNGIS